MVTLVTVRFILIFLRIVNSWQATDKLFCRAINVSCLPKIHADTKKSSKTELRQERQVMKRLLFWGFACKHDGLKQNYSAINFLNTEKSILVWYSLKHDSGCKPCYEGITFIYKQNVGFKCQIATFSNTLSFGWAETTRFLHPFINSIFWCLLDRMENGKQKALLEKQYHQKHKLRLLEGATWPRPPVVWAPRSILCLKLVNSYVRLSYWNYLLYDGTGWGWGIFISCSSRWWCWLNIDGWTNWFRSFRSVKLVHQHHFQSVSSKLKHEHLSYELVVPDTVEFWFSFILPKSPSNSSSSAKFSPFHKSPIMISIQCKVK